MENRKPFNPMDIDESLTRLISHGGHTYLMFPYINAIGMTPKFNSIGFVINGATATIDDYAALSTLAKQTADRAEWFISINPPWLITLAEAETIRQRRFGAKPKRA
jgi:hypothetical protein